MKTLRFLLALLALPATVAAQVSATTKLPAHPRLLLLKGEEKNIQKTLQSDQTWASLHGAILTECDRLIPAAPLERKQIGRRLLSVSREALRRVMFFGYAYRMTGDKKYRDRAEKELLTVSAFSDWNPSHFLDVAEMTMAVALGYDWLHDDLSAESRATLREAILKKGLEPSLNPKHNGWLNATHNWNQVCNAGMTFGALAIREDQPELADQIVNRAIETVVRPMHDYAPDGAYPEGYGYWGYGTSFNVLLISALEKAFGNDFGLTKQPGFLQTARYLQHMTGPTGQSFNYSDAGTGGGLQPAMFWFARKQNDPSLLWVEKSRLTERDARDLVSNRILPAALIWGSEIGLDRIPKPSSTMWVGGGRSPVALMRSSWTDPAGVYLGLKAGSPSVNHAHMDIGSFVMDADGVRWAMDFGMQSYESLESKGLQIFGKSQDAERWGIFRYTNRVHNTLTVDDELQRVDGQAPITSFSTSPAFQSATTDLTTVYAGSLAEARRGVALVDGRYVVVRDELETLPKETPVRWTMLTPANVKITGPTTAELTKDGKTLTLRVQEPAQVTLKTWSTDPPHDYDAPNPGTTLLGFEVTLPAGTRQALTVSLRPGQAQSGQVAPVKPLSQWPRR
jgi:hypothetical protein